jgi:hypothetical protein
MAGAVGAVRVGSGMAAPTNVATKPEVPPLRRPGGALFPLLAIAACFVLGALLTAPRASAASPPSLGSPIDHFRDRHSVGQEALLGLTAGATGDTMRVDRLGVTRQLCNGSDTSCQWQLASVTSAFSAQVTDNDRNVTTGFTEADLDAIAGSDPLRGSLEPGVAIAGIGPIAPGCTADDFCAAWKRPTYAADTHEFTGFEPAGGVQMNSDPANNTSVALAVGTFDPQVGPSLAVAWVSDDGISKTVKVANVVANRDGSGRVQSLALAGPVQDLGGVYNDSQHGLTSPAIAVGDFTGDGTDQLAVTWAPNGSNANAPVVSGSLLTGLAGGGFAIANGPKTFGPPAQSAHQVSPDVVALQDNRGPTSIDHLIVAPGIATCCNSTDAIFWFKPQSDGTMTADPVLAHFVGSDTPHSQLESVGDLTGDGLDEVVSTVDKRITSTPHVELLTIDPSTRLYDFKTYFLPSSIQDSALYNAKAIQTTVLDARPVKDQHIAPRVGSTDWGAMPQIAVAYPQTNVDGQSPNLGAQRVALDLLSLDETGKMTKRGATKPLTDWMPGEMEAPQLSAFAPDGRAELGEPVRGQYTQLEPSVVLNAPPTHFDILDGHAYDPNFCYAGNQYVVPPVCFFNTEYEREAEASTEVKSESTEDWAVSAKVTAGFSLFDVVNVDAEFRGGYGEKFTKDNGTTTTSNVDVTVKAMNTDTIYAIMRTYDTLEYPLYQPGSLNPSGFVLAVTPHTVSKRWIDSDSPAALDIKMNHQPGNILSYPEDVTKSENPFISTTGGLETFAHDEFELSDSTDYKYTLTQKRMIEDSASTEKNWNVGATIGAGGKIAGLVDVKAEVSGDYKNSDLSTTKTSAGSTTKLTSSLAGIDESFGETAYVVKPFSYWSDNATLVVDYAVEPVVGAPGAPKTWWQQQYGSKPDLTLNLPRLLDYEKQAGISSDAARFISPDVSVLQGTCDAPSALLNSYPSPGQPLCLRAQVENYSLKDQPPGATKVAFYDADPDVGGELIGEVDVPAVPAREATEARLDWTPDARYAGSAPRIFATVDAGDAIGEIHETNNKGYRAYRALADSEQALHAPDDVLAEVAADGSLHVEWSEPEALADTQPPGHAWRVSAYPESGGPPISVTVDGDESTTLISELPPGRYRVAVFSVLGGESSPASHPSEPVDTELDPPPSIAFTEAPAEGSYSGSSATFAFRTLPLDTATECVIDGLPQPCSSPLRLSGLEDGAHTIQVKATSEQGTVATPMLSWFVDAAEPEASISWLRKLAWHTDPRLRYTGADEGGSGLAGYEIRTIRAGRRGGFSTDPINIDQTVGPRRALELEVPVGVTLCASLRAFDGAGNHSDWAGRRCTTRPFDESELRSEGRWKRVPGAQFLDGHALQTDRAGASLSIKLGHTQRVQVLAGRCSECGKLMIESRERRRRVIDLGSTKRHQSRIQPVSATWPKRRAGRLELTSLGGGPVRIDGVAVWRSPD